jgi:hypothetical protein
MFDIAPEIRDPLTPKTDIGFVVDVERAFGNEP